MRSILTIGFLLASLANYAQITILDEQFNKDDGTWWTGARENYTVRIKGGKYLLETFYDAKGVMLHLTPYANPEADFSIQADFVQKSGSTNNSFGILWGGDGDKQHVFGISSNGYYYIGSPVKDKNLNEWVTQSVNPVGQLNQLRIEQKNGKLSLYLNNAEILKRDALPWYGKRMGIVNYTNMVLEVDNFIFKNDVKINLAPGSEIPQAKENLGIAINSAYDDLSPKISVDGKTLIFARQYSPDNLGGAEDNEDVWFATSEDGEVWDKAQNYGVPINTKETDNLGSISGDLQTLMFCKNDGFVFKHKTEMGWSEPERIYPGFKNESQYMEGNLSSDGKAIIFSVKTKDNIAYREKVDEKDLYVILRNQDGTWSKPINLGKDINTDQGELAPFLAADGRTLYFASEGWPGFGGADIFVSKRLDNTWTRWSRPQNLGRFINTTSFDAFYTVPASGKYAYMVSNAAGIGKGDIIRIKLPEQAKPEPVVLVKGKTLNAKTKKPISAAISFDDLTTNQQVGRANSEPQSGTYSIALPYGTNYGLHAGAKGFISVNENLELVTIQSYTEMEKDLYLIPIEIGESIPLNNVFFEQGKPILKKESFSELDRLAQILLDNPNIEIQLNGHTDSQGNKTALINLSIDRVGVVKKYLIDKGISAKRIAGKGFGPDKPIAPNDTEENRRKNRRVEFEITKK